MQQELPAVAIGKPLKRVLVSGAECWKKGRLIDLSDSTGIGYHDTASTVSLGRSDG
jgi:hypothetical protein